MEKKKKQLINDIEQLLNSYEGETTTNINPALLSYMDEKDLKDIIASLLKQKENIVDINKEWLEQFKKQN